MTDGAVAGRSGVALTGATGFIGSIMLRRLSAGGWPVRALYRPRRARVLPRMPGVEWIPGDLTDANSLAALVAGSEAVVHCAGVVRGARRADFDRVNEEGARCVARAAARTPGCRRLLSISSLAARRPALSDYAGSKRRGERAIEACAGTLHWTLFRPPAVYGPGDRELLPLFRGMTRGIAVCPGSANGRFSLLYVEDLASAALAWLEGDTGSGKTFELDDGHAGGYDWDTIVAVAAQVLHGGRRVRRVPVPVPLLRWVAGVNLVAARALGYAPMLTPGKVRELTYPDWVCDSAAFVQQAGWRPAFGLARGLASVFDQSSAAPDEVS